MIDSLVALECVHAAGKKIEQRQARNSGNLAGVGLRIPHFAQNCDPGLALRGSLFLISYYIV